MRNDDTENLLEALKIKVIAHEKFIISHLNKKQQRKQAFETFGHIYKRLCEGDLTVPSKYNNQFCNIVDRQIHNNVIDTYEEIYKGLSDRYKGRSGDAFMEKL